MSPWRIVFNIIGVIIEAIIISSFFRMFGKPKTNNKLLIFSTYTVFVIALSILLIFVNKELILFPSMLLAIFLLSFLYDMSVIKKILLSVVLIILLLLAEFLTGLVTQAYTKMPMQEIQNNLLYYMLGIIVSKMLLLVFIKAGAHYIKPKSVHIAKPIIIILLTLPLATFFIILAVSDNYSTANTNGLNLLICGIIFLIVANILLIYLIEWQLKQKEKEQTVLFEKQRFKDQMVYYQDVIKRRENLDKTLHDLKNKLFAISELVENNNPQGLEEIKKLTGFVSAEQKIKFTPVDSINALIYSKLVKMDGDKIKFNCSAVMAKENKITDIDLCNIVGNLLDNAIESYEKLENNSFIELFLKQENNYLIIKTVNSIEKPVRIINNRIETTKSDKQRHGFGIKNITETINKYDGSIRFDQTEDTFTVSILLSNIIID